MRFGVYCFSGVFSEDALLPVYKGSSFRGVFGVALKDVVCALKRPDCKGCLLCSTCVYSFIFEPAAVLDRRDRTFRTASPPHPYVIEPPLDPKTRYGSGEKFSFNLLLLGASNDYLPYFVYAFERMGKRGIGKAVNGRRPRFLLETIEAGGMAVFSSEEGVLRQGDFATELGKEQLMRLGNEDVRQIAVDFITPLRLKHRNSLTAELPFHVLIRAALRRIASLFERFGDGEPALDYRGLVARAYNVATIDSSLHWLDWKRYSNRQEQSMLMGGMTGRVVYSGDIAEFVPLLRFCEQVHLGKQTTFGLGKFRLTLSPGDESGETGAASGSEKIRLSPFPPVGEGWSEGES